MTTQVKITSRIPFVSQTILRAAKDAAKGSMTEVMERSKQIVPLDETPLMRSATLTITGDTEYIVHYGSNESAGYAVEQHETLWYRHLPGRQAKYLEQPFREGTETIIKNIENAVKGVT